MGVGVGVGVRGVGWGVGWGRGEEGVATGLKDPRNLLSFFNAQSTMTVISGRIRHVHAVTTPSQSSAAV